MSKNKNTKQLTEHKIKAIAELDNYIENLIRSPDSSVNSKADKLAYWIVDYARLLKKEKTFDPKKYISYRRGDIVKIHLGYRIGNEEGGLHFGVVIDNKNAKSSGTVTIIPLTSVKPNKKMHYNSVFLGTELFRLMISKHDRLSAELDSRLANVQNRLKDFNDGNVDDFLSALPKDEYDALSAECDTLLKKQIELSEIKKSILKMKDGSIALVDQITTVSKIRIYDPIYTNNVLYGIRLSDSSLDSIDTKIKELFLK